MPNNCGTVPVEEVIKFFLEEIDGTGNNTRNQSVPDSIRLWNKAQFCELTEDEFKRLEIPDGTKTLLKDKKDLNDHSKGFLKRLKNGEILPPLIIRNKLLGDNQDSSFYIEDGAHRAIALKFYFEENPYFVIKAYIGQI